MGSPGEQTGQVNGSTPHSSSGIPKSPNKPTKSENLNNHNPASPVPHEGKSQKVPKTPASAKSSKSRSKKKRSTSSKKKKGITFKKTVGVHTIPNIDTYSSDEKTSTWYMPDEYGQMEDECDLTAELIDRRKPLWPGQCPRGLEAWTTEGEQRKEGHVQLAIDIVWQAQLEQWKASTDIHECWEFIRSRYLAVSQPCHKIAHRRGKSDEQEVQTYLAGVRSVEKNRLRLLGIHSRSSSATSGLSRRYRDEDAPPSTSGTKKKIGRAYSEMGGRDEGVSPPGRHHSSDNLGVPKKGLLKSTSPEDELSQMSANRKIKHKSGTSASNNGVSDDDISSAASSKRSKKISYQPKSKSKIPTSPVQSLCSAADASDDGSLSRRLRSHMSVSSEDSTRRRMLRTASIKPPL